MAADLSTHYLGLKLRNPLVVAACPLTGELDVLKKLADYGAAAAVLPSLFEEQLAYKEAAPHTRSETSNDSRIVENLAQLHELKEYNRGSEAYLTFLSSAKQAVSIPIIGSMNVTGPGEMIGYARRIEEAGADALELNIYFLATDPHTTSRDIEARCVELVAAVRARVSIPLAVKIGPYYTALPHFVSQLVGAGADGLVLFNRFMQPGIDLDTLRVAPRLALSTPDELRLTLRWIALLYGRIDASLAATGGAHFADDCIKLVLAGADVVMVASTLYLHGVEVLGTLIDGVRLWLDENDYISLEQAKGSLSQSRCPDPSAFERANYTKAIASFLNEGESTPPPRQHRTSPLAP